MSDVVIRVENLGKLYRIGKAQERYPTLRDALTNTFTAPLRRLRSAFQRSSVPTFQRSNDHIWALKDVSFEVKRGEVLGIIGRNGAGKSTLLKILSRITEPTEGRAETNGRVGSLLEVGTGFHPELTGRENIYLNGAILGMKKAEIERKFAEIVAFAEIEKFLDTPVKHYSSGMYVRLAFAVAAHLEPEILLVDEVLAVGDAAFQKKCLGKMGDVAREGRTVLFVSHNMGAVQRLCERCLLLEHGALLANGPTAQVVHTYMRPGLGTRAERVWEKEEAPGDDVVRLRAIRARDSAGNVVDTIDTRQPIGIEVEYWNLSTSHRPSVGVHLWNSEGIHLFASHDYNNRQWYSSPRPRGLVRAICWVPGNFLAEGRFFITMTISSFSPTLLHHVVEYEVVSFEVIDNSDGDGVRGPARGAWPGVIRPMLEWNVEVEPEGLVSTEG
jgi:lipopolysaccharide transport system ATP-binding protein